MRSAAIFLPLVLLLVASAAADDGPALIRTLPNPDAPGYGDALERWEATSEADRIAWLREALHGEDEELARTAARALGPEFLSWGEVRRQWRFLVEDPEHWIESGRERYDWAPGGWLGVGGPDVVPLFRHAVSDPDLHPQGDSYDQLHRVARPDHLPALVPLLEKGTPETFGWLLRLVRLLATYDTRDAHRDLLAHGFGYALARLRAEAAGMETPSFAAVTAETDGEGLPEAFQILIENAYQPAEVKVPFSHAWLRRWGRVLEPTAKDVEVLRGLVGAFDSFFPFWALRHLVRIGTPEALAFVVEVAEGDGSAALPAAAALHEGGLEGPWETIRADEDPPKRVVDLAWAVDPEWARARALAEGRSPAPYDRRLLEVFYGIRVREQDLSWLEEKMRTEGVDPIARARFFTEVRPENLTTEMGERIAEELRDVSEEDLQYLDVDLVLGLLEIRAPEALKALLRHRAPSEPDLADVLVRLGEKGPCLDAVEARARGDDAGAVDRALEILAVHHGLRPHLAEWTFAWYDAPLDEEPYVTARKLVLAGDPAGAVLHLHEGDMGMTTHELGLIDDERARAILRGRRDERHLGFYWHATAGLAIAGDEAAREEFLALLADDRTWMFDCLSEQSLSLEGDRSVARLWASKIDHNCCLAFHAHSALKHTFPTLPYEHGYAVPLRDAVTAWLAEREESGFAWSRLLGGWVPR